MLNFHSVDIVFPVYLPQFSPSGDQVFVFFKLNALPPKKNFRGRNDSALHCKGFLGIYQLLK